MALGAYTYTTAASQVDLDETLLNTARQPHVARARELTAAVQMLQGGALRPRDFHELPNHALHFMKLRPGVDEFLVRTFRDVRVRVPVRVHRRDCVLTELCEFDSLGDRSNDVRAVYLH